MGDRKRMRQKTARIVRKHADVDVWRGYPELTYTAWESTRVARHKELFPSTQALSAHITCLGWVLLFFFLFSVAAGSRGGGGKGCGGGCTKAYAVQKDPGFLRSDSSGSNPHTLVCLCSV